MLGGVNKLTTILFTFGFASDRAMLKIGAPAILSLLILGAWVRAAESGFVNYYRGNFENALTDLRQKGDEGNAYASYLVGQIYATGKAGPKFRFGIGMVRKGCVSGEYSGAFFILGSPVGIDEPASSFLCRLSRGGATERESQKHLCVFIFVSIPCQWCL